MTRFVPIADIGLKVSMCALAPPEFFQVIARNWHVRFGPIADSCTAAYGAIKRDELPNAAVGQAQAAYLTRLVLVPARSVEVLQHQPALRHVGQRSAKE